jgi:hypothetical protein
MPARELASGSTDSIEGRVLTVKASRPLVGSSRIITEGSATKMQAMLTRLRSPPEIPFLRPPNPPITVSATSVRPSSSSVCFTMLSLMVLSIAAGSRSAAA